MGSKIDFLSEIRQAQDSGVTSFKELKEKKLVRSEFCIQQKYLSKMKVTWRFFPKRKPRELITSRPAHQEMLETVLWAEGIWYQTKIKKMENEKMWINMTDIFLNFNLFKRQLCELKILKRHCMFHKICWRTRERKWKYTVVRFLHKTRL